LSKREVRFVSIALLSFLSAAEPLSAQSASPLTAQQTEGRRLYAQSCGVCHFRPLEVVYSSVSAAGYDSYGPLLYGRLIAGREAAVRTIIAQGSARMPGFRYHFSDDEIAAIIAYLKTVPEPSGPTGTTGGDFSTMSD